MDTTTLEDSDDEMPVVIDNGSGLIKAGFGGNDLPSAVFPSIVGRPRHKGVMVGMNQVDVYVGDESWAKRGILCQKYPIEHGIVTRWDDMEKIWHHTFYNELQIAPDEHSVLLTETVLNPKANREKMTQIIFETFNVPSYYVLQQAVATLYSCGATTGLVIESGESVTRIVPIYEGYCLPDAVCKMYIGGRDITQYLRNLLNQRGYQITGTSQEIQIVKDMKQKYGFVAMDYDKALEADDMEQEYELPDGLCLSIGKEQFECTELLFKPEKCPDLVGLEYDGIAKCVYDAIQKCDADVQNELFENIIFGGGNTMFKGIEQRLLKELNKMVSKEVLVDGYVRRYYRNKPLYKDIVDLMNKYTSFTPKIVASEQRAYSAWIGGSILSSLTTFEEMWIEREEYDEFGPSIVHRKCT